MMLATLSLLIILISGCLATQAKRDIASPDFLSSDETKDTDVGPQSGFINVGNVDLKSSVGILIYAVLFLLYLERVRYSKKMRRVGELLVADNFKRGLSTEDKERIRTLSKVIGVDKDLRSMVDKNRPRS